MSGTGNSSLASGAPALAALISGVRARYTGRVVLGALMLVVSGAAFGLAGGSALGAVLPEAWRLAAFAALSVAGALGGIAAAALFIKRNGLACGLSTVADIVSGGNPQVREVIVTGADLGGWGEAGAVERNADPALVEAQLNLAERYAAGGDADGGASLTRKAGRPALEGEARICAASLVVLALVAFFAPVSIRSTLTELAGGYVGAPVTVGNLTITYRPPAYTGLGITVEEGGSGDVRAYAGTLVELSGALSAEVEDGVFIGPDKVRVPVLISGNNFNVEWSVRSQGLYGFEFHVNGERVPLEFAPRSVRLLTDNPPEVEMTTPEGDVEAMNIDEVEVTFAAADDFGVVKAEIVLAGDEEVRLPVEVEPSRKVAATARFLPAAYPQLGEGAYLSVEAWDNDDVSGSKAGVSRSVFISFYNAGRMRREMQDMEARLLEALLSYLADHLENPTPDEAMLTTLRQRSADLKKLLESLSELAGKSEDEGLFGAAAVTNIRTGLDMLMDMWIETPRQIRPALVAELERDIIFLDKMMRQLRMEEALDMGDELSALQRDLFERLQSGEDTTALLEAVNRIEQILQKMAQKLSQSESLPDEFANSDAVKEMPEDQLSKMLEELKQALDEGDREKASELAEQIMQMLDEMMNNLEEAADSEMQSGDDHMSRALDELQNDINQAIAEQERLLGETRTKADAATKRRLEELAGMLDDFLQTQRGRLDQINRNISASEPLLQRPKPANEQNEADRQALLDHNNQRNAIYQAVRQVRATLDESLGEAGRQAEALGTKLAEYEAHLEPRALNEQSAERVGELSAESQELASQIAEDIRKLLDSRAQSLSPEETEGLKELGGEESELSESIESIGERLRNSPRNRR